MTYGYVYVAQVSIGASQMQLFNVLDSKEPDWSKFRDFLMKEVRYTSLKKSFPAEADELFAAAEQNAKWRYNGYQRLAKMEY